jgi:hypothetical protein
VRKIIQPILLPWFLFIAKESLSPKIRVTIVSYSPIFGTMVSCGGGIQ